MRDILHGLISLSAPEPLFEGRKGQLKYYRRTMTTKKSKIDRKIMENDHDESYKHPQGDTKPSPLTVTAN